MVNILTEDEVKDKIFWYFRNNFKNQLDAANKYNCSRSFISAVVHMKKPPTKEMMIDIGIKRITTYTYE